MCRVATSPRARWRAFSLKVLAASRRQLSAWVIAPTYAPFTTVPYISSTATTTGAGCLLLWRHGQPVDLRGAARHPLLPAGPVGTGFFSYGSYKITPDIQASLMLNYGYNRGLGESLTIDDGGAIKSDNAFLNPNVLATMLADGQADEHHRDLDQHGRRRSASTVRRHIQDMYNDRRHAGFQNGAPDVSARSSPWMEMRWATTGPGRSMASTAKAISTKFITISSSSRTTRTRSMR